MPEAILPHDMKLTFHAYLVPSHASVMCSLPIQSHEIPQGKFWEGHSYKQRKDREKYCRLGCTVWLLSTDVSEKSNVIILYCEMKAVGFSEESVNGYQTTLDYSTFVFTVHFVNTSNFEYNKPVKRKPGFVISFVKFWRKVHRINTECGGRFSSCPSLYMVNLGS